MEAADKLLQIYILGEWLVWWVWRSVWSWLRGILHRCRVCKCVKGEQPLRIPERLWEAVVDRFSILLNSYMNAIWGRNWIGFSRPWKKNLIFRCLVICCANWGAFMRSIFDLTWEICSYLHRWIEFLHHFEVSVGLPTRYQMSGSEVRISERRNCLGEVLVWNFFEFIKF